MEGQQGEVLSYAIELGFQPEWLSTKTMKKKKANASRMTEMAKAAAPRGGEQEAAAAPAHLDPSMVLSLYK